MTTRRILLIPVLLALASTLSAQDVITVNNIALHPISYTSPEVHPDHTVTLRLLETTARSVSATVNGVRVPMTKDDNGIWNGTTAPLDPDVYAYRFNIDGTTPLIDPRNTATQNNLQAIESVFIIPSTPPMPWEQQPIPHGAVTRHLYTTQVVKGLPDNQSEYYVYTPPGYDPKAKKPYPTLYLIHGFTDAADGWLSAGRANFIFDALIHNGKMKPMVVVMPLGYGDMALLSNAHGYFDDHGRQLAEQALLTEVLPQVESAYRVDKKREARAVAGLSMGGLEALELGLGHPELFSSIGAFSSSLNPDIVVHLPTPVPKRANLKLLWMACGDKDRDFHVPNQEAVARLKQAGLPVTPIETPGTHSWHVWRDNLIHFAPLLFQ